MPRHVMTARRRAALRKAQLASARKRRSRRRKIVAGGVLAGIGGLAYARHVISGSYVSAGRGVRMGPTDPNRSLNDPNLRFQKSRGRFILKKFDHKPRTRYVLNAYGYTHMYGISYHHFSLKNSNPGFRTQMVRANKLFKLQDKIVKTDGKYFRRAIRQDIKGLNKRGPQ